MKALLGLGDLVSNVNIPNTVPLPTCRGMPWWK